MTDYEFLKRFDNEELLTENEIKDFFGDDWIIGFRGENGLNKIYKIKDRYFCVNKCNVIEVFKSEVFKDANGNEIYSDFLHS